MSSIKEKVKIFKKSSRKRLPCQKQILSECSNPITKDLSNIIKEKKKRQWKKFKQFEVFMRKLISKKKVGSKRNLIKCLRPDRRFSRQIEPKNSKYFMKSYEDGTSYPFGGLFISLHPHSTLRLKSKYRK